MHDPPTVPPTVAFDPAMIPGTPAIVGGATASVRAGPPEGQSSAKPVFKMKRTGHRVGLPSAAAAARPVLPPHQSTPDRAHGISALTPHAHPSGPSSGSGSGPRGPDPKPASITSDIVVPAAAVGPPTPAPSADEDKKRQRAERLSQQLKERWASGSMSHVHLKARETIERRKLDQVTQSPAPRPSPPYLLHPHAASPGLGIPVDPGYGPRQPRPVFSTDANGAESEANPHLPMPQSRPPLSSHASSFDSDDLDDGMGSSEEDGAYGSSGLTPSGLASSREPSSAREHLSTLVQTPVPVPATPGSASLPGRLTSDAMEMWEYIRPFLKCHKAIPSTGWVPELIGLKRVRDVEWRSGWIHDNPYIDSKPRDISSLIVQLTGEAAPAPCSRCREGKGPYNTCVMISTAAPGPSREAIISCANCFYHFRQTFCSHKGFGKRRASLGAAAVFEEHAPQALPQALPAAPAAKGSRPRSPTIVKSHERPAAVSTPSLNAVASRAPIRGSDVVKIEMAAPGRPYKAFLLPTGELDKGYGTLFPEGYKLDHTFEDRPWICPVRSCRIVFKKRLDLGSHFPKSHYKALMNDNGDGTLSIMGYYEGSIPGEESSPCVVVSRNPPGPAGEAIHEPQLPRAMRLSSAGGLGQDVSSNNNAPATSKTTVSGAVVSGTIPSQEGESGHPAHSVPGKMLWQYLQDHMVIHRGLPDDIMVRDLLTLPRVRDIGLRTPVMGAPAYSDKQITAALLHVTGEQAPQRPCTRCRHGHGPFIDCIIVASATPARTRNSIICCSNCFFTNQRQNCSLKDGVKKRNDEMDRTLSGILGATSEAANRVSNLRLRKRKIDALSEDVTDEAAGRSHGVAAAGEPDFSLGRKLVTLRVPSQSRPRQGSTLSSRTGSMTRHASAHLGTRASAVASGGPPSPEPRIQGIPVATFQMEEWETKAGRVRSTAPRRADADIAFSRGALSSNVAVRVSEMAKFRVDCVQSGHRLQLEVRPGELRSCSVASGQVRVLIEGEPVFAVGPHGLFKLEAGMACTVENRNYDDAILHSTLIAKA